MRLEARVMIWMAVLLGAAAALALALMARLESSRVEQQWTEAGRLIAESTEDGLEVGMLNNSREDIRRTVRNVEEGELVDSVTVYRRSGTPWVTSDPQLGLSDPARAALLASMDTQQTRTSRSGDSLSVFVPVLRQPECVACHAGSSGTLGAVEVRLDERPFRTQLTRSARTSLAFVAIPLLVGILVSVWAVRRSVLRPLAEVSETAEKLGQGDMEVRLPAFRSWEFEELSTTFNDMASRLERKQTDLRETAEELRSELAGMEEIQSLLTSGAGLRDVLMRAAGNVGRAVEASGVAIWRAGLPEPEATWGVVRPDGDARRLVTEGGPPISSEGDLEKVDHERAVAWAIVPAKVGGRVLAALRLEWDPPRALAASERDLLGSLAGLVGIAVRNAELLEGLQQKEQALEGLLRKTLTVQEEERRRLSRELHDETSQVLSALIMNVELLESQTPVDEPDRGRIRAVKSLAEEAARNLDRMLFELRPALLDELGLMPALRWFVAQMSELWDVPIEFEGGGIGRLPDHVELAAFRIVQEAVSNAVRHASPSIVRVRASATPEQLRLEVEDDGVGFDAVEVAARARTGEAVGLEGMRERAEIAGGTFRVDSVPGRGTRVLAELPLPRVEQATPAIVTEGGGST